ncbi:MAG: hypothetical protein JKY37_32190, partial [Nannocystaceae bacterium]|nr:hypothetical protein [Nannocystaceae bacterium]
GDESEAASRDASAEALDEALDLVASALWGSARALVTTRGGTAESMQVQFGADGRFTTFERVGVHHAGCCNAWRHCGARATL